MNRMGMLIASAVLLMLPALGQDQNSSEPQASPGPVQIQVGPVAIGPIATAHMPGGDAVFWNFDISDQEPIKNAPYTATALTESTQTLADGTHIANKNSALLARDSQGRTRREETFRKMGPLHVQGSKVIVINDPVANTEYILRPDEMTARTMKRKIFFFKSTNGSRPSHVKVRAMRGEMGGDVQHEDLGSQVMEGLTCQGSRDTTTIRTGAMGNDRPLVITSESWYSPDLHAVVMHKRSDPRFGETTYHLTNITLGEPDPSLFQVPADYKIIDNRHMHMDMNMNMQQLKPQD